MALPRLLAGPLLRSCSEVEVTLWLATSQAVPDLALVMETLPQRRRIAINSTIKEIQVGRNFFIYLILAKPADSKVFQTHSLIGYDVRPFTKEESVHLVYPGLDSMTVVLQERGGPHFRALYGSCRKYHGPGFDASRAGDHLMVQHAGNPAERPDVLLLGGDQIYADDVSPVLIRPIQNLARELFGFDEAVPGIRHPAKIPIDGRAYYVTGNSAHFTSGHSANHLLTFGEFCAAYLFAWNHKIWDAFPLEDWADTYEDMKDKPDVSEAEETLNQMKKEVEEYKEGSRRIQRLMANLPTYMIFDDHEITDDWFLNNGWKSRVLGASLGKRIIANGLAAFWLFQAIGNAPRQFALDADVKQQKIERHLRNAKSGSKATGSANHDFERAFLSMVDWSFIAPSSPPVVFINTRTARTRSASHIHTVHGLIGKKTERFPSSAPRLLNANEISRLTRKIEAAVATDPRLVLMVATPVFGLDTAEEMIQFIVSRGGSASFFDFETYHSDPNSFLDLTEMLVNLRTRPEVVTILSGDVHYGFAVAASILDMNSNRRAIPVAQFISSAMKNRPEGMPKKLLDVFSMKVVTSTQFRYWWRPGSDNAAHSSIPVAPVNPDSQGKVGLQSDFVQRQTEVFNNLSTGATLRVANAFKFELAGSSTIVEKNNNMGLLELDGVKVNHRLLKWNGSFQESLHTSWHAYGWPVEVV